MVGTTHVTGGSMSQEKRGVHKFFLVNEDVFQERVRELALEWITARISELYGVEDADFLTETQRCEIQAFLAREEQLCPYLSWALETYLDLV